MSTCPRVVGSSENGRETVQCGRPMPCAKHSLPAGIEGPRSFVLFRDEDVTGVSGVGVVAWGVEFPDGVVALRWKGDWPTSVVFHDRGLQAVLAVHGHDGRTHIIWVLP